VNDDDELLGYLSIHCRTDLGLVHRDHLKRLFELAGEPVPEMLTGRDFWNTDPEVIDPLVAKAQARLASRRRPPQGPVA
jgi:hypothetical protein